MCGNKIHRQMMNLAKCEEFIDPYAVPCQLVKVVRLMRDMLASVFGFLVETAVRDEVARCRTADAEFRIDGFDDVDGLPVQFKILAAGTVPESVKIRFVPYLKIPAADFLPAVALKQMADKMLDQSAPAVVVRRRGDMALPPELSAFAAFETIREEAQFDKRTDILFKQCVIELVDVLKVIHVAAILRLMNDKHIVVKQTVAAQIRKADFFLQLSELLLKRSTQPLIGPPRAHTGFPVRYERVAALFCTQMNHTAPPDHEGCTGI